MKKAPLNACREGTGQSPVKVQDHLAIQVKRRVIRSYCIMLDKVHMCSATRRRLIRKLKGIPKVTLEPSGQQLPLCCCCRSPIHQLKRIGINCIHWALQALGHQQS